MSRKGCNRTWLLEAFRGGVDGTDFESPSLRTASLSRLARLARMYGMADEPGEDEQKKRQSPPPVEFLRPGETKAPLPARVLLPDAWVPLPVEYQSTTSWMPPSDA